MSAASPASAQVRRNPVQQPARATTAAVIAAADREDQLTLNLGDIPRMQETMEIDGLKPSLLSRLFDLVAPLDRR